MSQTKYSEFILLLDAEKQKKTKNKKKGKGLAGPRIHLRLPVNPYGNVRVGERRYLDVAPDA